MSLTLLKDGGPRELPSPLMRATVTDAISTLGGGPPSAGLPPIFALWLLSVDQALAAFARRTNIAEGHAAVPAIALIADGGRLAFNDLERLEGAGFAVIEVPDEFRLLSAPDLHRALSTQLAHPDDEVDYGMPLKATLLDTGAYGAPDLTNMTTEEQRKWLDGVNGRDGTLDSLI